MDSDGGKARAYRFGSFTLRTDEHALFKGNEPIHLRPKVYETLLYLVERRGSLVKKDELFDTIWPEIIVTENTLSQCIDAARKALGDNAQHPEFIQTVPRLGFKFIGDVAELNDENISAPSLRTESDGGETDRQLGQLDNRVKIFFFAFAMLCLIVVVGWILIKNDKPSFSSIAVLPFTNLNGDVTQDYFADGMTESLIANLGKMDALRVISRTSVMTYKDTPTPMPEIAHQLNVDAVVEGSVLRAKERVRITVKLINANTDQLLWVKSYERNIQDILTLQRELARAIAAEIQVELTPEEQTHVAETKSINPEAYQAYLKGRYFWNKRTADAFEKAKQQFLIAIEHDSNYAPAYAGLADTYTLLGSYGIIPSNEATAQAKKYALKALALDETLAEAHVALATTLSDELNWTGAEREFMRAIELNPNYATAYHWYSAHLIRFGRLDEAIKMAKKACAVAPLSLRIRVDLGYAYYYARLYDEAIKYYKETLELDPNFAPAHSLLGLAYLEKGQHDLAVAKLKKGMKLRNADFSRWLGYAYAVSGRTEEAIKELAMWKDRWQEWHEGATVVALIYTGLGEKEAAFEWLEKAFEARDTALLSLKCSPHWDTIRADERFQSLLLRIGIPRDDKLNPGQKITGK